MRAWHYLGFLFTLAILSRIATDPNSPGLIDSFSKWLGNLFKGTIGG